mmetsp:Transcript_10537/g.19022  ORF Transcript_10537/g.19022 Transcript_10537/m.19022 type:complete len:188 (+) Transcript_10537:71-634(+)
MSGLLQPRKIKWPKQHLRFEYPVDQRRHVLRFGQYGLKVLGSFDGRLELRLKATTLEAVKKVLVRKLRTTAGSRKGVKTWIRTFPDRPVTKFGAEQRMGKGKGSVDHYECQVRRGHIFIEFNDAPRELIVSAYERAKAMLPFRIKLVEKPRPTFYELKLPIPSIDRLRRKPDTGLASLVSDSSVQSK